jgi:hypothetical protein
VVAHDLLERGHLRAQRGDFENAHDDVAGQREIGCVGARSLRLRTGVCAFDAAFCEGARAGRAASPEAAARCAKVAISAQRGDPGVEWLLKELGRLRR